MKSDILGSCLLFSNQMDQTVLTRSRQGWNKELLPSKSPVSVFIGEFQLHVSRARTQLEKQP